MTVTSNLDVTIIPQEKLPREQLSTWPNVTKMITPEESERLQRRFMNSKHSLPRTPKDCLTCGGTGIFKWWSTKNRNDVVEYECNCKDQWKMHRFFLSRGIPRSNQTMAWWELKADQSAMTTVYNYVEHSDENFRKGIGLFLWGRQGTGKTMMGSLILKDFLAKDYTGFFTSFVDMMRGYSDGFDDKEDRTWFLRNVMNTEVLLIDDPGKEQRAGERQIDYAGSTLDTIIRTRVANMKPTIITSNDSPDEFKTRYGESIYSLLTQAAIIQNVQGLDFRKSQNERLTTEVSMGLSRPVVVG